MKVETTGDGYFVKRSEMDEYVASLERDYEKLRVDAARDPTFREARICTFSLIQWLKLTFPAGKADDRTLSRGVTATQNTAPTEELPGTKPDGSDRSVAAYPPGRMKAMARKRLPFSSTGLTHQECGNTIITIRGKYYCPACEKELEPSGDDDE